jgi:hypothetical protein
MRSTPGTGAVVAATFVVLAAACGGDGGSSVADGGASATGGSIGNSTGGFGPAGGFATGGVHTGIGGAAGGASASASGGSTASGGGWNGGAANGSGGTPGTGSVSGSGGSVGTGGVGSPPPPVDGRSVYSVQCEADSRPCNYPAASCLGIYLAEGGVGYSCSNLCNAAADCSDAPSGAEAESACVQFTSAKHCVLLCYEQSSGLDRTCPAGMSCYRYPNAGLGYCLWL